MNFMPYVPLGPDKNFGSTIPYVILSLHRGFRSPILNFYSGLQEPDMNFEAQDLNFESSKLQESEINFESSELQEPDLNFESSLSSRNRI